MELKLDGIMVWVEDVPATAAFYEEAFGLKVQMMNEEKTYAQMNTGEITLSFAHEGAAEATGVQVRPNRTGDVAPAFQLALVAEDVEAAFAQAVQAGAQVAVEIVQKPGASASATCETSTACWSSCRVRRLGSFHEVARAQLAAPRQSR